MNEEKPKGFYLSFRWKMIIIFTVLFTVVFGAAFYIFLQTSTNLAIDRVYDTAFGIARNAVANIDGDTLQALYEDPNYDPDPNLIWPAGMYDERYWEIAKMLLSVFESNPDAYPYTYTSPEPGKVEYLVSFGSLLPPDEPGEPAPGAIFKQEYFPSSDSVILNGMIEETKSLKPIEDIYGNWYSVFVPIKNSDGEIIAALGVDYQTKYVQELEDSIIDAAIPIFIISYIAMFVSVYLVSSSMTAPIIKLTKVAETISEGVYESAEIKQGATRDEVSTLTQVFNLMVEKVRAREEKLKKQVAQLQIVIDSQRQQEEVALITETDFFQGLQDKAKELRSRQKPEDKEEDEKE